MIHILGMSQTKVEDIGPPFMCVHYPCQVCVCVWKGGGGSIEDPTSILHLRLVPC